MTKTPDPIDKLYQAAEAAQRADSFAELERLSKKLIAACEPSRDPRLALGYQFLGICLPPVSPSTNVDVGGCLAAGVALSVCLSVEQDASDQFDAAINSPFLLWSRNVAMRDVKEGTDCGGVTSLSIGCSWMVGSWTTGGGTGARTGSE